MRIIAGEARGRKLAAPPAGAPIRPALDRIRESVFAHLEGIFEDGRVLDLFAGVGSFGLEAVSRGARRAVFVDRGRDALRLLRRNIDALGFGSRCEVQSRDALHEPAADSSPGYALIFVDPPFKLFATEEDTARVIGRVSALRSGAILAPGGRLVLRWPSRGGQGLAGAETERVFGESTVQIFAPESPAAPGG